MASKFRSVLTDSEREYAKRMFPYIQMESRENNFTEVHYDPVTILRKMSQNCTEFLQKCRWEGVEVNCDDLFSEIIIPSGLCYSLNNFNKTYRRTSNFSYKMGLSVLINPDLKDHMTNKITKGITVDHIAIYLSPNVR
ncbi:uncharacterized protein LOC116159317 [Photinus pyralis]|uniref:uncharacterized protein LOC116159317 n=1 Tax=Photinus pyralis TaxID=7054 RepID=UPI001266EFFD|nr:uncharacterized protein LOC116159317 [Photinus pyralis]